MIDWETAYRIAEQHVASMALVADGDRAVIDNSRTVAYEFGWLFHFQSSWYLQSGDDGWQLLDNHPFLVGRNDGHIVAMPRATRARQLADYARWWEADGPTRA